MTANGDPWRTLGLAPGAPLEEIRRAYRRLAKANHPDAAGEAALPRFLAIQAAYESLAGPGRARRPGARPGASAPSGEPWRADPARARASGRGDGRARPAPGARPAGSDGTTGGRGAAGAADSNDAGATRGGGATRDGDGGAARSGGSTGGRRARSEEPAAGRRPGGRRRASNRATPGSTSYDAADEEPFEPGWTGATWYGASSGTYWTINPKEYADPRKHGPEYLARARRSAGRGALADSGETAEAFDGDPPAGASADEAESTAGPTDRPSQTAPRDPSVPRPTWTSAGRAARAEERTGDRAGVPPRPPPSAPRDRGGPPGDASAGGPLVRVPSTSLGRLALALLGWPPLGVAVATGIGESTGCGRFAASCGEVFSPGTWIVQIAIILLLLAIPQLAAWSAVGTLAALAAAIPTAVVLSAGGGSRQPDASAGLLLAVLGLAYLAGVAWAIVRQRWPRPG